MLFHRWETISHIISDTKLSWFTKKANEDELEDTLADDENDGKKNKQLENIFRVFDINYHIYTRYISFLKIIFQVVCNVKAQ